MSTKWNKPRILEKGEFKKALQPVPLQTAREFREIQRNKILNAKPSGNLYRKRSGAGFTRSHRASRKGQRFATDTGETLRSLKAKKTGELSASVEFESKTAKHLIDMERLVISSQDEKDAQDLLDKNAKKAVDKLF